MYDCLWDNYTSTLKWIECNQLRTTERPLKMRKTYNAKWAITGSDMKNVLQFTEKNNKICMLANVTPFESVTDLHLICWMKTCMFYIDKRIWIFLEVWNQSVGKLWWYYMWSYYMHTWRVHNYFDIFFSPKVIYNPGKFPCCAYF